MKTRILLLSLMLIMLLLSNRVMTEETSQPAIIYVDLGEFDEFAPVTFKRLEYERKHGIASGDNNIIYTWSIRDRRPPQETQW